MFNLNLLDRRCWYLEEHCTCQIANNGNGIEGTAVATYRGIVVNAKIESMQVEFQMPKGMVYGLEHQEYIVQPATKVGERVLDWKEGRWFYWECGEENDNKVSGEKVAADGMADASSLCHSRDYRDICNGEVDVLWVFWEGLMLLCRHCYFSVTLQS